MSNTLFITVEDLPTTILSFDQIQVHRSPTVDGVFVEVTTPATRIDLDDQDNLYEFIDPPGVETDFYRTIFFNSTTTVSGVFSDPPVPATPLQQLLENMEVQVFVSSDIKNTDGINLTDNIDLFFTTKYNPLYCGVDKVLLDVGNFLNNIEADTINRAIYEASREADILTFNKDATALESPLYIHARRQWSCCMASLTLLNNLIGGVGGNVKSKRLGDFSVEYDTLGLQNMFEHLMRCRMTWEPQLNSGGAATQKAAHVVKGDLNIDMPFVGRDFETHAFGGLPMINSKVRRVGSRRLKGASFPARVPSRLKSIRHVRSTSSAFPFGSTSSKKGK